MKKKYLVLFFAAVACCAAVDAQVFIGGQFGGAGYYGRPRQRRPQRIRQEEPPFTPAVYVSVGYGFPNLDKYELPVYYNYFTGTATQTGPITGAIDYQFNRRMSIGVMVTHGKVNMPYYDYNDPSTPAMHGALDNWSYMINFMRYMPVSNNVTTYIRTAIGVNSWTQNFTDGTGNKINPPTQPSDLAYQIGLGARFTVTKNTGLFVEAGYGKYIIHGGLSFKF